MSFQLYRRLTDSGKFYGINRNRGAILENGKGEGFRRLRGREATGLRLQFINAHGVKNAVNRLRAVLECRRNGFERSAC